MVIFHSYVSLPEGKWIITYYNPNYKSINPTIPYKNPIYNVFFFNPLTKWDEPP